MHLNTDLAIMYSDTSHASEEICLILTETKTTPTSCLNNWVKGQSITRGCKPHVGKNLNQQPHRTTEERIRKDSN